MRNRAGIDASDKKTLGRLGLVDKFEHFFAQYVDLYESDAAFEAIIDPWQVIVIEKPPAIFYLQVVNDANHYIGGIGPANAPGEPIQFQHGLDWLLLIPSGRENARRVASYISGACHGHHNVGVLVQDFRVSLRDA